MKVDRDYLEEVIQQKINELTSASEHEKILYRVAFYDGVVAAEEVLD